jgi:hypothetical protein
MCTFHVAGQLGLKNLSERPFVCLRNPYTRDHLDLDTITKKVFEGRIKEVPDSFRTMMLAAAKKSDCFKK